MALEVFGNVVYDPCAPVHVIDRGWAVATGTRGNKSVSKHLWRGYNAWIVVRNVTAAQTPGHVQTVAVEMWRRQL